MRLVFIIKFILNIYMEIIPHFWINYYDNNNYSNIKEKKIKYIIHLSKYGSFINKNDIDELRIPINYTEDDTLENKNMLIYQYLYDVTEYIHDKIIHNKNILLLGENNKEDLDIFIVAYFIRYGKMNIQNAFISLKSKKNIVHSKSLFYYALNKFSNELNN